MNKIKKKLTRFEDGLKKWILTPGRNIFFAIAIILAVIIIATVLVGIVLGCLGAVASIPALLLMFAFNLVVPACGGPALTLKMSVGLVILTIILIGCLCVIRK